MDERMQHIQNMAERRGSAIVCKLNLEDSSRNRSQLTVRVDSTGWLSYQLGNGSLSNLQCSGFGPERFDRHDTVNELAKTIKFWVRGGTRKVLAVITGKEMYDAG